MLYASALLTIIRNAQQVLKNNKEMSAESRERFRAIYHNAFVELVSEGFPYRLLFEENALSIEADGEDYRTVLSAGKDLQRNDAATANEPKTNTETHAAFEKIAHSHDGSTSGRNADPKTGCENDEEHSTGTVSNVEANGGVSAPVTDTETPSDDADEAKEQLPVSEKEAEAPIHDKNKDKSTKTTEKTNKTISEGGHNNNENRTDTSEFVHNSDPADENPGYTESVMESNETASDDNSTDVQEKADVSKEDAKASEPDEEYHLPKPFLSDISHLMRDDFTYTYSVLEFHDGNGGLMEKISVRIMPLEQKEDPAILVWATNGREICSRISTDRKTVYIRIGKCDFICAGDFEDGKFVTKITLPNMMRRLGVSADIKTRGFGTEGHIYMTDEGIKIHALPLTTKNNEHGWADIVAVIQTETGSTVADTQDTDHIRFDWPGMGECLLQAKWKENELYCQVVRP